MIKLIWDHNIDKQENLKIRKKIFKQARLNGRGFKITNLCFKIYKP